MPKYIPKLLVLSLLILQGCATSPGMMQGNTTSLLGLQSMHNYGASTANPRPGMGRIREMALKETALSLGAQAALACRAKIINDQLANQARQLDAVYDFNALILEHNILPPVLLEGRNTFNMPDAQTIRVSDRTYKVFKQAQFITAAPNWRQYLWMDYQKPEFPNVTMLPRNKEEQAVWNNFIQQGWKNGEDQANIILEESVARIKQDINGMLLYRKLLAMNMVSPPYVSQTELGVTGDTSEMHIDDRVLRITALPLLNTNSKDWKPALTQDVDALQEYRHMEKAVNEHKIIITDKAWQPNIAPVNTYSSHR